MFGPCHAGLTEDELVQVILSCLMVENVGNYLRCAIYIIFLIVFFGVYGKLTKPKFVLVMMALQFVSALAEIASAVLLKIAN